MGFKRISGIETRNYQVFETKENGVFYVPQASVDAVLDSIYEKDRYPKNFEAYKRVNYNLYGVTVVGPLKKPSTLELIATEIEKRETRKYAG